MRLVFLFFSFIFFSSCDESPGKLEQVKTFSNFPSASAIEYIGGKYYVMGDDSRYMLVLDEDLAIVDSISLYNFTETRMPKASKADIESITLSKEKLLLLGSGSLTPYRNAGWLIDPVSKQKESIRLDTIYARLHKSGLKVINIEGGCSIPGRMLLANRGNYGWRNNYLVVLQDGFWKEQDSTAISLMRLGGNTDTVAFNGVSGLAYAKRSDRLLITVSTEQTSSSTADGAIGKSYLWIVNDISTKRNWKAVNPNRVIDLEALDQRFAGHKIESVCVRRETNNKLDLVLAADNDDGSSTIFMLQVNRQKEKKK